MKAFLVACAVAVLALQTVRADAPGPVIGIGTELKSADGHPVVAQVVSGSPADKAGIKPNDRLTKVDGKSVDGLSLVQVSRLLRGDENSRVKITVDRDGESKDFAMRRAILFLSAH